MKENEARKQWEKLQQQWREVENKLLDYIAELRVKYGGDQYWRWMTSKERRQLEVLLNKRTKIEIKMREILERFQKRPFNRACPAAWVWGELTWEEIVEEGQLPRIPPPARGLTEEIMEWFAAPIDSQLHRKSLLWLI